MPNVSNLIKTIQDIMRKDAGVDGDAQRLAQLGWMFFLKIFDDREKEMEVLRDHYRSPLPKELRWSNWATDEEGITGDALLAFANNDLLPKLKVLSGSGDIVTLIRAAFDGANNYMKNGTLMRQVINKINGIDFNSTDDRHLFGDIYEKLLKDLQSAGNAGEFYTPRAVTQFIVEQVDPRLGETVLDPACGTGGFLVCAIEHLRNQAKTAADERALQTCFAGIEKKHLPHVLCMTNLLLHGIDVPSNVRHDNTLARPLRDWGPKERVNVIVTNPPFGGMEEDGIGANYPAEFRTRETADLFLVLLMKILKPGGRAGLVLPDGTLFGEGVKTRIKESLLTECNLHTIVRLPNGVFNPYTGIRTNLLFFTKGTPTKEVWYYEHPLPARRQKLQQGQTHPHRRVRSDKNLVGRRSRRLCIPRGKRAGLARVYRHHPRRRLQPRPQEPAPLRRRPRRRGPPPPRIRKAPRSDRRHPQPVKSPTSGGPVAMKKKPAAAKRVPVAKAKPPKDGLTPLITEVRGLIQSARRGVSSVIDTFQVMTNFEIGRRIVEHEQKGEKRAAYGAQLLKDLSGRLTVEFGRGFSAVNLSNMRRFFLLWQERVQIFQSATEKLSLPSSKRQSATDQTTIIQTVTEKFGSPPFLLSWTHYVELLGIKDPDERSFYEIESAHSGWNVRELKRQKASCLYHRLALSRDKAGVKRLSEKGQILTKPEDALKDPYVLEFLGLDEKSDHSESDLESAIITHLEKFLLELGKGFLFEARQKRFTFDADHYFLDLVFYNRLLRCYLVIDLKLNKLTHQDLGQMQMYVNYYDRHVKLAEENPTIGIVLCREKNDAVVKLTLPKDANIHAKEYQLYLPSKELLKAKLLEWTRAEEAKA